MDLDGANLFRLPSAQCPHRRSQFVRLAADEVWEAAQRRDDLGPLAEPGFLGNFEESDCADENAWRRFDRRLGPWSQAAGLQLAPNENVSVEQDCWRQKLLPVAEPGFIEGREKESGGGGISPTNPPSR